MKRGDRVRVIPGNGRGAGVGVVVAIHDPRPDNGRTVEVKLEGPEWFYPYRTWFSADELEPA